MHYEEYYNQCCAMKQTCLAGAITEKDKETFAKKLKSFENESRMHYGARTMMIVQRADEKSLEELLKQHEFTHAYTMPRRRNYNIMDLKVWFKTF